MFCVFDIFTFIFVLGFANTVDSDNIKFEKRDLIIPKIAATHQVITKS